MRFHMYLNVDQEIRDFFFNLASQSLFQAFSHRSVFVVNRRQERDRGVILFRCDEMQKQQNKHSILSSSEQLGGLMPYSCYGAFFHLHGWQ